MAAISHVFTLARVAQMLGEDEDWLSDISMELEPEDGIISVYGLGEGTANAGRRFEVRERRGGVQGLSGAARQGQGAPPLRAGARLAAWLARRKIPETDDPCE